ncbi:PREDICTED: uncharacterized protein LOC104611697 [Nelumbo nucifera]|uniref:Uncharacterized protein LOC104611697 n=2 Tax=Nelumbo nucifera TaxID=4432 RepID=A0A1U8BK13_NELNU|nr:PREDICTED: uncharacterized protein LOC104611697 [Nelumbo nucifera]DAD21376.1 TPA_asm: hypothetical protein HUJ06_022839 [Nelumbo nucifera]
MDFKTCTCRIWDISGIPCAHALAVLTYTRGRVEELCDKAFHKDMYVKVYNHFIHALLGEKYWSLVDYIPVRPPAMKRRPGRPLVSRRREEDESGPSYCVPLEHMTVRRSICIGLWNNIRNCCSPPQCH